MDKKHWTISHRKTTEHIRCDLYYGDDWKASVVIEMDIPKDMEGVWGLMTALVFRRDPTVKEWFYKGDGIWTSQPVEGATTWVVPVN
jgi:hypothetical protein